MNNKEKMMKPFDLEAAKAGAPVCTRDGRDVRIICYDAHGPQPIVVLVTKPRTGPVEYPESFNTDGSYFARGDYMESIYDLFIKPTKREGWVNIYGHQIVSSCIFSTEEGARDAGDGHPNYLATARIEWEE